MMKGRGRERVVELRAPRRAFARGVPGALERLGYRLVPADRRGTACPDARIAAAPELRRIPGQERQPVIRLDGRRAERPRGDDPRVVATLRQPAPLGEVYRALQLALEEHPRRVPRAALVLPARFVAGERDWPGAVVSLSEDGCLVRSSRSVAPDRRLRIWFPLPGRGLVQLAAQPLYERAGHAGLAFIELEDATRRAIAASVERMLLGAH
jgi:PilZ domain